LYITMNTAAGVRDVDAHYIETARSFGLTASAGTGSHRACIGAVHLRRAPSGMGLRRQGMVIAELWVTTGTGKLLTDLGTAVSSTSTSLGADHHRRRRARQLGPPGPAEIVAPWSDVEAGVRAFKRS